MNDNKLKKQAELLNRAFHQIFHGVMLGRSDMFSDKLKGFGFIDLHILDMAYENPDLILKEIRDHVKVPQTTLSSIVAKLELLLDEQEREDLVRLLKKVGSKLE
jgi:DNA-binding MarR family transcriptional regulator